MRAVMRRLLLLFGAAFVLLVSSILARTARYGSVTPPVEPASEVAIPTAAAERNCRIASLSDDLL
jgi:hypothetical protein